MAINEEMMNYVLEHLDEILEDERVKRHITNKNIEQSQNKKINNNKQKYEIGFDEIINNLFYIFASQNMNVREISYDLVEKYTQLLKEKSKNKVSVHHFSFIFLRKYLVDNADMYKDSKDHKKIVLDGIVTDSSIVKLVSKQHAKLPMDVYEVMFDLDTYMKIIELYGQEEEKANIKTKK